LVSPEKDRIKIQAIRELQWALSLSPVEGRYRVCIISRADTATLSAANSLLKTLEEPPARVVLVLTADRSESLLPTIVSRCQVLNMRLLPTEQIVSALRARGIDQERAWLLGHLAQGRIGWALASSQDGRGLDQRDQTLEELSNLGMGTCTRRFAWAERLSQDPDRARDVLQVLASWWRDVLLLASGSGVQITNVDHRAQLVKWAARHDVATAHRTLRCIRKAVWCLEHNVNRRLALEVLMLDVPGGA
jgi:DNA polymerase-3 subunit delta'